MTFAYARLFCTARCQRTMSRMVLPRGRGLYPGFSRALPQEMLELDISTSTEYFERTGFLRASA